MKSKSKDDARITFRCSKTLKERLIEYSKEKQCNVSDLIRIAVIGYLPGLKNLGKPK